MKPWELKKECGVKRDLMEWEREEAMDFNTFPLWGYAWTQRHTYRVLGIDL